PRAVELANTSIWGTLSCVLLVHPQTEKQHPELVDEAIATLRYGAVAVNLWGAVAYGLVSTTWGAFPGHPLDDIRSGRGVVHNAFLFDHPQKSVVRAPFRISPLPLWFAGHRTLRSLAPKLVNFEAAPTWYKVPAVIWDALRG
ncbi:MAG: NAD-dependent aldehyde dehydrogenase, partial [Cyanobacteria bacterium J06639_1]